jgi:hypothetical protein
MVTFLEQADGDERDVVWGALYTLHNDGSIYRMMDTLIEIAIKELGIERLLALISSQAAVVGSRT